MIKDIKGIKELRILKDNEGGCLIFKIILQMILTNIFTLFRNIYKQRLLYLNCSISNKED